jgi:PAS domain S-box-containing protein
MRGRDRLSKGGHVASDATQKYGQLLFETLLHGVIFYDADGSVDSVNPAALRILGITPERLAALDGQQRELIWLREDGSACPWQEQPAMLALQTGQAQSKVMKLYHRPESRHCWLRISATPLFAEGQSRPVQAYALLEDISSQKEEEQAQQEQTISLALSSINDGFWDWSLEKNRITFSGRWWSMLGYLEKEISDEPDLLRRVIHPEDQSRFGQQLGIALAGGDDILEMEIRLKHKLGHDVPVFSRVSLLRDADGKVTRVCGTHVDITKRLKLEEDLRQYQRKLEVVNQTLEQRVKERTEDLETAVRELEAFSYSVSHDLRAPLRHINSFSAILSEDYYDLLPEEVRGYLGRIGTASSRMGTLIDALLELSRVSRTGIHLESVNLSEIAVEILQMYHETEPHRMPCVTVREGLTVWGDRTLLGQLLENLLGNAWKYTALEESACIEFGVIGIDGEETFFVKDNGVGFDMEHKQKLFKSFERLHGPEFPGTGIGLATSARIIKRHGGRLWAEGKVGQGATCYFTLPVFY